MSWFGIALILGVMIVGILFIWIRQRSASRSGTEARFDLLDYVLLWPLLLTKRQDGIRVRRDFTRRELLGWGVVFLVILLAMIFDPGHR